MEEFLNSTKMVGRRTFKQDTFHLPSQSSEPSIAAPAGLRVEIALRQSRRLAPAAPYINTSLRASSGA